MIYDLCVNLSTIAAVNAGSLNTSFHLLKARFDVTIVDFLSALNDKNENNNSLPSLSNEIYPSSSYGKLFIM